MHNPAFSPGSALASPAPYTGRFAPTPSGPLHMGSLVAALGSWLDARAAGGRWLLRIEDVDTPRVVRGAADAIQRQLEGCGLWWDGEVVQQSHRRAAYEDALQQLRDAGQLYRCNCTRARLQQMGREGEEGVVYPGHCRAHAPAAGESCAWRLRTTSQPLLCQDRLLPSRIFNVEQELGDFVLQRADGIIAYQLAVVVDDAWQGVTHIVRGADLYLSTPRQMWLQQLLQLPHPHWLHLPLVVNERGEKLSKQTLAPAIQPADARALLWSALQFLGQEPAAAWRALPPAELLQQAVAAWDPHKIPVHGGQIDGSLLG